MITVKHWRDVPAAAWLWPNFTPEEMACRHCGELKISIGFMNLAQALRWIVDFPLPVSSAYRCPVHNAAVSSTGAAGPHTTGKAGDLGIDRERAFIVLSKAPLIGFTGVGIQQKGGGRYIHLDTLTKGPDVPRPTAWSY